MNKPVHLIFPFQLKMQRTSLSMIISRKIMVIKQNCTWYRGKHDIGVISLILYKKKQTTCPSWSKILDHSYRTLPIGGSESGKANALLSFKNYQPDIDKIYLYAKRSL